MIYIFGMDIDDCLSTEYYIEKKGDLFEVKFRGHIYDYVCNKMLEIRNNDILCHFFISSFSARQSLYLDCANRNVYGGLTSAQLLYAFAKQLATHCDAPVTLDQTWLADYIPSQTRFSEHLLKQWLTLQVRLEPCNFKTLLECAENINYKKKNKNSDIQQNLKTFRVWQIIDSVANNYAVPPSAPITLYLFDDRRKYLTCIKDLLSIDNRNYKITTLLNDPFHQVSSTKEHALKRNRLEEVNHFHHCPFPTTLGFKTSNPPLLDQNGYQEITASSPGMLIDAPFVESLDSLTRSRSKFPQEQNKKSDRRHVQKDKTVLEQYGNDGSRWGLVYPTYPYLQTVHMAPEGTAS